MTRGGRLDNLLNSIPGYAGYRDKERRRETDRVIRDRLALEYGQLAERLGRLATTLAQERNIAAIPLVDRPHRRLVSFIDRIRTASYGYAPLFSDRPVDERALDQIAAFDRSLADKQEELAGRIAALESGNPRSPEFKQLSQQLTDTIEGLHHRFDKRSQVIDTAEPLSNSDVIAILEPESTSTPAVAYRLHEGEAVSYGGVDYSVIGRVSAESQGGAWRAFQLRGGSGDRWLVASRDAEAPLVWAQRVEVSGAVGDPEVRVGGAAYNRVSDETGDGDVIGPGGAASNQRLRLARYRAGAGEGILLCFDWETGTLALAGAEIDSRDVQLFTREG